MKQIVIIGGGGFGRELVGYLRTDIAAGRLPGHVLAGVADGNAACEVRQACPDLPYLGDIEALEARPGLQALVAIGSVRTRLAVVARLTALGLPCMGYVHSSALVATDARIGTGTLICPNTIVNSGAVVGEHCVVNVFCSIGHGAQVGAFSVLSPYSALNGNARLGARGFLGTRATVFPGVHLGDSCVVDTHAYVKVSVPDRKMVSVRGQYLVVDNRLGP